MIVRQVAHMKYSSVSKNAGIPWHGSCREWLGIFLALVVGTPAFSASPADVYQARRLELVKEIEADVRETSSYIDADSLDPRVMKVMGSVPRHEFVPLTYRTRAYENRPLPIGHGQTISQPYIVALMTDLLRIRPGARVLEVGTGSGYQTAVLAEMAEEVFTIEIIEALGEQATERLNVLEYGNVRVQLGDGYYGWEEYAPFDAIVVTAAASHIPPPLVKQLKPGGRMVIPVGGRFQVQQLTLIDKDPNGKTRTRQILPVRFVPLTGKR
jgi:protein-L-isoaspartate(D-aspartate) O-methyltransferase